MHRLRTTAGGLAAQADQAERPAQPHPDDAKPEYTDRILQTVQKVFGTESRADFDEDARSAERVRASRPDYSVLTDEQLLELQRRTMQVEYFHILKKRGYLLEASATDSPPIPSPHQRGQAGGDDPCS